MKIMFFQVSSQGNRPSAELREAILIILKLRIPSFFELSVRLIMWVRSATEYGAICPSKSLNNSLYYSIEIREIERMMVGPIEKSLKKSLTNQRKLFILVVEIKG